MLWTWGTQKQYMQARVQHHKPRKVEILKYLNRQKQVILSGILFRTGENLTLAPQNISTKIEVELDLFRRYVYEVYGLKSCDKVMVRCQRSLLPPHILQSVQKTPHKLADISLRVN